MEVKSEESKSASLTSQSSSATVFHQIHHKFETKVLFAPASCAFCKKFIWGFSQQAVHCVECDKFWHPECESQALPDCGLTFEMLAGALSVGDSTKSSSSKKSKKADLQYINGHVFKIWTYQKFTWCACCKSFIWGLSKQGWKCTKCDFDCHTKCLSLVNSECMKVIGGQLQVVEGENRLDSESSHQVQERRTTSKKEQFKFNKQGKYGLKPKGRPAHKGFGGHEHHEESDSDEEEAPPAPSVPLNKNPELVGVLGEESSFSSAFQTGSKIRSQSGKSESSSDPDSVSVDDMSLEEFEEKLADFDIDFDKVLGSGQFGVVRTAVHKRTKTVMAVKIIDKKKFWGRKNSQRHLKREIAILSSLKHPNIITLHAVIEEPTDLYLFMELVKGGDLLQYVESKGHLVEDEAKFLFHQLCVGVKYLHEAGVIHRDLKPENLLLCEEHGVKRIKLADFGFANIIGEKSFLKSVVGTPAYVAPEILKKTKGYQKSADMWSIGVIMYACLSGVFPFDEDEPVEDQIRAGKFCFPDQYWKHVSDEAIDLICHLLVVDPKQRYTIDDVLGHPWFSVKGKLKL